MFRKAIVLVGVTLCLVILGNSTVHAAEKEALIIGMQDDSISLDPAATIEATSLGYINELYEQLVDFDHDDFTQFVPGIAESWNVADDGKTWTFYLRSDSVFASGNPIDADTVVFSLQRVLQLDKDLAWLLKQFGMTEASLIAIDAQTVQIELGRQYAQGLFFSVLASVVGSIVDQQTVLEHEQDGDLGSAWLASHSAGSGRFVLDERLPGGPTTLLYNERYAGEPPIVKKLIVKNIQEPFEQAISLENGEIDIAWDLHAGEVRRLEMNPDLILQTMRTFDIRFLGMNLAYEPLKKPEVRDAIRYAIDYDGLVDFVVEDGGEKIQTIIPEGMLGYNPSMPYKVDPDKARQLLADAGYADGFDIELACENFSPWSEIAIQIKSDLEKVGINVTIKEMAFPDLVGQMFSQQTQLYLVHWKSDYFDPDANVKPFAHCDSLGDDATVKVLAWVSSYLNEELSQLVDQATQEQDQDTRLQLYQQITDTILDDGPYAILFSEIKQYGTRIEVTDMLESLQVMLTNFPPIK